MESGPISSGIDATAEQVHYCYCSLSRERDPSLHWVIGHGAPLEAETMKLQPQLLLLASVAAALVMSRGVLAGSTHAMPVQTLHGSIVQEDDAGFGAAYPQRRVLANGDMYVSYKGLEANKAACYGSCPGRGQPYTGRGCKNIFGCPGS